MHKPKSLTVNAIMGMIDKGSSILFPLITYPYISRILQADGLGKVNFAQSIIEYFIIFSFLGIPLYGKREVSIIRNNKQQLSNLILELFLINSLLTLLVFFILIYFILFTKKGEADPILFWVFSLNLLLLPMGLEWLFQGLEEFAYITQRAFIVRMVTMFSIFLFIREKADYRIYALITVASVVGSNIFNFINATKYIDFKFTKLNKLEFKKHFKPILTLFVMSLSMSLYVLLDKVMLGYMTNDTEVGYYTLADKICKIALMPILIICGIFMPRVSYHVNNNRTQEHKEIVNLSMSYLFFLGMPLMMGMITFPRGIIVMLAGNGFTNSIEPLQVMSFKIIFIGISNMLGFLVLWAMEKDRAFTCIIAIGGIISVLSNFILIPLLKAMGASISSLIAEVSIAMILCMYVIKTKLYSFEIKNILKYILCSLIIPIISAPLVIYKYENIFHSIMIYIIGIFVYCILLFVLKDTLLKLLLNKVFFYCKLDIRV